MLKSVRHNPERFNLSPQKVKPFEKLVAHLERQLLGGKIYQVRNV